MRYDEALYRTNVGSLLMPSDEFLEEVKLQFARHLSVRTNIDQKANNIITIAGTISTLLLGFIFIILPALDGHLPALLSFSIPLIIGILLMITSIIVSGIAYVVRNQKFPIVDEKFFIDNDDKKYNTDLANEWINADKKLFNDVFIEEYLLCIRKCREAIESKSSFVRIGQILFVCGISTIPIAGGLLIKEIYENPDLLSQIKPS